MHHLPVHLGIVLGGVGLVHLRLSLGPTGELAAWPAWVALLPLLLLPGLRRLTPRAEALAEHPARLRRLSAGVARVGLPLAALALALFLTRWPTAVGTWAPAHPGWSDLAWLPLLLPLALLHLGLCLRPSDVPADLRPPGLVWALLGWGTLTVVLTLATLPGRLPGLRGWVEVTGLGGLAYAGLLLVTVALVVPRLLLVLLDTVPPPALYRRLAEAPAFGGVAFRLQEWRTGDELANAMVLAMPLGPRPVLFTDAFFSRLLPTEFEGVLAHELGHVRGRHVALLVAWVLALALGFDLVAARVLPPAWLDGSAGVALALAWLGVLALAFGWVSRRLELEADLYALEATGRWQPLARVLTGFGGRRTYRSGWRHFGALQRVAFLRAASRDPGVGARLRRGLVPLRVGGPLLLAVTLGMTLVDGAGNLAHERVWVDLTAGDLRAAEARYAELDPEARGHLAPDDEYRAYLATLLELGAGLQGEGALTVEALGRVALDEDLAGRGLAGLGRLARLADLALLLGLDPQPGLWRLRKDLFARHPARPDLAPAAAYDAALPLPGAWEAVRADLAAGLSSRP